MKTTTNLAVTALLASALCLVGCGKSANSNVQSALSSTAATTDKQPEQKQDKMAQDTALSNPATVYCLEQGGQFTMSKTFDGSSEGHCLLPNNISCEVWAHYNGDCPAGSKKKHQGTATSTTSTAPLGNTSVAATSTDSGSGQGESGQTGESNGQPSIDTGGSVKKTDIVDTAESPDSSQNDGLVVSATKGEEPGEIITKWKTNGLSANDGFIVMLSGQEQVSYPTKYFHALKNPQSRSFVWDNLVTGRNYYFRVCIAQGDSCKTYSQVVSLTAE